MYDFFKKNRDGIMNKTKLILIILAGFLLITGCSTFIRDEDSQKITLQYQAGEYILLQDVVRNNVTYPKNSELKLLVVTGDDWLKIYAYNSGEELLNSKRFLLLYMFKGDFPDKKFSQEILDLELSKMVKWIDPSSQSKKEIKKEVKTETRKKQKK